MIALALMQVVSSLALPLPDTTNLASKAELDAAIAAATPGTCATPQPDTLTGSAGVGVRCMPRVDATRPTVIQAKTTVTASDATYTVTFDKAFDAVPIYVDARVYGQNAPYLCSVTAISVTGAAGKCYQLVATTLPVVSTSLLGLVISPVASAAAGLSVRVVARQ